MVIFLTFVHIVLTSQLFLMIVYKIAYCTRMYVYLFSSLFLRYTSFTQINAKVEQVL